MTMYEHTRETVGRYTVRVVADDTSREWEDVLCDEPMMVLHDGGFGLMSVEHDGSKRLNGSAAKARIAYEKGGFNELPDDWRFDYTAAPTKRHPARIKVEASTWDYKPRYFSTEDRAAAALFEAETGFKLADLRCEQFDTQRDTYWLVWLQSELDAYAGVKGARPPHESVRHWLDGDVWGWIIGDEDFDHLESCWGFIGEADDCLEVGREEAEAMEAQARKRDAEAYAEALYEARPDLAPAA